MNASQLFEAGLIHCQKAPLFEVAPGPKPQNLDPDRLEGMLLGLAIGDALGAPTESMLPSRRSAQYGEIRDYVPNRYTSDGRGYPTDDTQLAFWTLESLTARGGFDPHAVAESFTGRRILGIGSTVRAFLRDFEAGASWEESGQPSAGNGALMRIAPVLLPHLGSGTKELWDDTAIATMITHNDPAAIASSVAFIAILWELLDVEHAPEPAWWRTRFLEVSGPVAGGHRYRARGGGFAPWEGPFSEYVEMALDHAEARGLSTLEACNQWYSGAYLLETVPSVLYILMRYGADPEEAIVRAVNDTKDNDTVAAIVGTAVGALHGRSGLPERWVRNLSGRTTTSDDGRVFELTAEAVRVFWTERPR
jgi:ADP-ribosylglycohydrolase